jgi:hypothetical protein
MEGRARPGFSSEIEISIDYLPHEQILKKGAKITYPKGRDMLSG